jgi:hypothetical protein
MGQSARVQIAALTKDDRLVAAVLRLCDRWGEHAFDIVDHWEANLHGVGLSRTDDHAVLVYVDNFGKADDTYEVELENPSSGTTFPYVVAGNREAATFDELSSLVGKHLGLQSGA